MSESLLLPKFLTADIAEKAVRNALLTQRNSWSTTTLLPLKYRECPNCGRVVLMLHVVVLVPAMKDAQADGYPNYPIEPHLLYECSEHKSCKTDTATSDNVWPWKFDEIARCKALQLWQGRNDDRIDVMPHLLFPGDAPFWGGVKRHGIVVATSGVQPHFDKMISGVVADICVAMAHDAWLNSQDHKDDVEFLS